MEKKNGMLNECNWLCKPRMSEHYKTACPCMADLSINISLYNVS